MNTRIDKGFRQQSPLAVALLLVVAALLPGVAVAIEPVGRIVSVTGQVTAFRADESARSLDRGDAVYEGDEIRTGEQGNTQIRFDDGGLFDLDPDTRFQVDRYRVEEGGGGSALLSFLTGALRTITGSIGGTSSDTYRLSTPTATIGIRGTDYVLHYCDAACAQEHGGQPGLYGRVDDGAVRVNSPRGSADYRAGEFFFVPQGGTPRVILRPPQGILDGSDGAAEDGGTTTDAGGDVSITPLDGGEGGDGGDRIVTATTETVFEASDRFEPDSTTDDDATNGDTPDQQVTGLSGAAVATAGTNEQQLAYSGVELFMEGGPFQTDASGNVTGTTFSEGENLTDIKVDGAELIESGSVPALAVDWGRWEGSFIVDGKDATGHMAFAITDNFTDPAALSGMSGTIDYGLAGGPKAFDNMGELWTVDALSLFVDFDAIRVGLNEFALSQDTGRAGLDLGDAQVLAQDVSDGGIGLSVVKNNVGGAAIVGRFVGAGAEGMVVGFQANTADGQVQVTGTSVLQQQ